MTKDELVQEIGTMLINDCKLCSRRWQHLVIVAQLMEVSTKVNGFAYENDNRGCHSYISKQSQNSCEVHGIARFHA